MRKRSEKSGRIQPATNEQEIENILREIGGPAVLAEIADRLGLTPRTVSKYALLAADDPKSVVKARKSGVVSPMGTGGVWVFWIEIETDIL